MAVWQSVVGALWLFLPAFIANMSPVFTAKLLPRWRTPIDFGAHHTDGRRVLGAGKTWRGLILGGGVGGITAALMARWPLPFVADLDYGYADGSSLWGVFLFGFVMGTGALTGDALESFFKRRLGKERGAPWVPFDQLDFVAAGLAAALLWHPLLVDGWAVEHFLDPWVLGTLLVGTPALHLMVNRIGYWLKLKDVPW